MDIFYFYTVYPKTNAFPSIADLDFFAVHGQDSMHIFDILYSM